MDKSFLLEEISKPIGKAVVVSLAAKYSNAIPELIKLCLHSDYEMAFGLHGSWKQLLKLNRGALMNT